MNSAVPNQGQDTCRGHVGDPCRTIVGGRFQKQEDSDSGIGIGKLHGHESAGSSLSN